MFDALAAAGLHAGDPAERELLWAAAMLHDTGVAVDYDDHHKHSMYLILNGGLPGFSPREIALVALIARYHRKGDPELGDLAPYARKGDEELLERCAAAGQQRPTPLILKYAEGDYNCLHQDLYGELVFPIQATVLLSSPGEDFTGGEFLLVEQRPRMQSKGEVVPLAQGDAVLFAVNYRPVAGTRGDYRVVMRHGVSRLRSGHRFTLGIIFHDAA
jgi:hypothetical protein